MIFIYGTFLRLGSDLYGSQMRIPQLPQEHSETPIALSFTTCDPMAVLTRRQSDRRVHSLGKSVVSSGVSGRSPITTRKPMSQCLSSGDVPNRLAPRRCFSSVL